MFSPDMSLRDVDLLVIMCLFWFGVGWSIGRFGKEERKKRKERRRFRAMTRKRGRR